MSDSEGSLDAVSVRPPEIAAALRAYQQGDMDGVMVLVSREACEVAAALLDRLNDLTAALQWYADGLHFDKASPDEWDTVSGEPQNWWCDAAGTATVEDGSLAGMALAGDLTAEQIQALDTDGRLD